MLPIRATFAVLALALSAAAIRQFYLPDLAAEAAAALSNPDEPEAAVTLSRAALAADLANPYRWADLAEALAATEDAPGAAACFKRALELAPHIPQIWVRHANFAFMNDDAASAVGSAARVLETVPDFDSVLFPFFTVTPDLQSKMLDAIGGNRRAVRSWLNHLMAANKPDAARQTWARIAQAKFPDDKLAIGYVEYLLRVRDFSAATAVWSGQLGPRRGAYPARNLLFNGGFSAEPAGGPFDWRIAPRTTEYTTTLGDNSAQIAFTAKTNLIYDGLSQIAVLPAAGAYRFSVRVKTQGLTTNEGIRLAIPELNLLSEPILGTRDWSVYSLEFSVPAPCAVRVGIIRQPSQKFDNKIQGTAWIASANLFFASSPPEV